MPARAAARAGPSDLPRLRARRGRRPRRAAQRRVYMRTRLLDLIAWSTVLACAGAAHAQLDAVPRNYQTCTATYPAGGNCPSIPIPDSPGQNVGGPIAEVTLTIPSDPDGNTIIEVIPKIWIQHGYQGD